MSSKVGPYSLDSTLDTDTFQVIGPHTNKPSPDPSLSVYLIVRDACQICGEAGDGGVIRGDES